MFFMSFWKAEIHDMTVTAKINDKHFQRKLLSRFFKKEE